MRLIQCYMKNSTWYCGRGINGGTGALPNGKPVGVLWHDTAAGNPNLCRYVQPFETDANYDEMIKLLGKNKYNNDWNHIVYQGGLNAWIGKLADGSVATVQTGELTRHPWGCAKGKKGSCNGVVTDSAGQRYVDEFWVQFEICDDSYQDKSYFEKVYKEACEFTAYVCKQFGIDPKGTVTFNGVKVPTILCHKDSYKLGLGSDHSDVYKWFNKFGKTMDDVRNDVERLLKGEPESANNNTDYTLFKEGTLVSIKPGAVYTNGQKVPDWVLAKNWYVNKDAKSEKVVIDKSEDGKSSIMSIVNMKYLSIVKKVEVKPTEAVQTQAQPQKPETESNTTKPEAKPSEPKPEMPIASTSQSDDPKPQVNQVSGGNEEEEEEEEENEASDPHVSETETENSEVQEEKPQNAFIRILKSILRFLARLFDE